MGLNGTEGSLNMQNNPSGTPRDKHESKWGKLVSNTFKGKIGVFIFTNSFQTRVEVPKVTPANISISPSYKTRVKFVSATCIFRLKYISLHVFFSYLRRVNLTPSWRHWREAAIASQQCDKYFYFI